MTSASKDSCRWTCRPIEPLPPSGPRSTPIDTNFVRHEFCGMAQRRNVTITLDEETARWARVEAARRDTSVSRFVGDLLREQMHRDNAYEDARRRFLAKAPYLKREEGRTRPRRDELHDRSRLR
jgi:hypothetical protein